MSATRPLTVAGAKFLGKKSLFRPTAMSVAMAAAGVIPGTHMVGEQPAVGLLRNRNDMTNLRPSIQIAL
jgi:hypothetical protein